MKNLGSLLMKNTTWFGLVATLALPLLSGYAQTPGAPVPGAPEQAQAAVGANLSPGAAEVVRLAGSGVGDDVVLAYIQNSQAPFSLTADNVLYLKDQGLSPQVTSAMLSHDSALRGQPQQYAPAAPAPAMQPPVTPVAPAPTAPAQVYAPAPVAAPTPVAAPAPAYVTGAPADVSYFYNDLSPYGTWVYLEGYGWCWQPRAVVVSPGWRPYCDGGYWVYSDAGWYWQSSYSWGWAPFHYGRWYMHPHCGWVWTPDRVWGPAWVTWRTGGDCCGWAPLPPHAEFGVGFGWRFNGVSVGANFDFGLGINAFAFVSFGDFCSHDIHHNCLPPARVNTVYRQTTIVNNYVVNNNRIENRGVPIERVSSASRTPVPRATVRDLPAGGARVADRTGSVVYRRQLRRRRDRSTWLPRGWMRSIRPFSTPRSRPPERDVRPPSAAAPRLRPPPSASRQRKRPRPRPGRAAGSPLRLRSTRRPRGLISPRPQRLPANAQDDFRLVRSAKPAASSQYQSTPRTSQWAPATRSATATPRAPEEWKQGSQVRPGYRSDTGLSAQSNSRAAVQSTPATGQTSSAQGYYPKGYHQAAEMHPVSQSGQRQSSSPSSSARSSESHSGKN